MKHPGHIFCGVFSVIRRITPGCSGTRCLSTCRRFAVILSLCAVSCAFCAACSPVDSAGTIPRSNVHAPRKPHRLTVIRTMLFEFGENPLEKRTVNLPEGEYVFEGEDDIFMYFRSLEPLEYRVNHKEGYADGFFQMGGIALATPDQWEKVKYPVCTYTDGEDQNQKRLTCPLEPAFVTSKRGIDWESDFDREETAPLLKAHTDTDEKNSATEGRTKTDTDAKTEGRTKTDTDAEPSATEDRTKTDTDAKPVAVPFAVPVAMPQIQTGTDE